MWKHPYDPHVMRVQQRNLTWIHGQNVTNMNKNKYIHECSFWQLVKNKYIHECSFWQLVMCGCDTCTKGNQNYGWNRPGAITKLISTNLTMDWRPLINLDSVSWWHAFKKNGSQCWSCYAANMARVMTTARKYPQLLLHLYLLHYYRHYIDMHMHINIYTYIHTYIHYITLHYINTYIHTYIHTKTYIHTYIHSFIHS